MPTKHIDDNSWKKVQDKTVEAVISTRRPIKETEMLNWLIKIGLKNITDDDFMKLSKK